MRFKWYRIVRWFQQEYDTRINGRLDGYRTRIR